MMNSSRGIPLLRSVSPSTRSVSYREAVSKTRYPASTAVRIAAAGVRTIEPLAFWTDSRGRLRNFFLYRFVEGDIFGDRWMGELESISPLAEGAVRPGPEAVASFVRGAGELLRTLHEAGVVHTDPHPKNFVFPDASRGAGPFSVIDLDSARTTFAPGRRALFTSRIRSLRRLMQAFPSEIIRPFFGSVIRQRYR